jgi:hypothetical protein
MVIANIFLIAPPFILCDLICGTKFGTRKAQSQAKWKPIIAIGAKRRVACSMNLLITRVLATEGKTTAMATMKKAVINIAANIVEILNFLKLNK